MSCNMVFSKLIKEVGEWSRHNFGSQKGAGALAPLAGIVEEIGELRQAKTEEDIVDSYVDMTIFLADVCARCEVIVFDALMRGDRTMPAFHPEINLGNLCHAVLKLHQGIRGANANNVVKHAQLLINQIVDGYYHSCREFTDFVQRGRIMCFDEQVQRIWNVVKQRDWKKWPETGRPPVGPTVIAKPECAYPDWKKHVVPDNATVANFAVAFATSADLKPIKYSVNINYGQWLAHPNSPKPLPRCSAADRFKSLGEKGAVMPLGRFPTQGEFTTDEVPLAVAREIQNVPVMLSVSDTMAIAALASAVRRSPSPPGKSFKTICRQALRGKTFLIVEPEFFCRMSKTAIKNFSSNPVLQDYDFYDCDDNGTRGHMRGYDCYGQYK